MITCERSGCNRTRYRKKNGGYRRFCSNACDLFTRSYKAFTIGGAATGRDSERDAELFAFIAAAGPSRPECYPTVVELGRVYG